jgi:hypothetical protein
MEKFCQATGLSQGGLTWLGYKRWDRRWHGLHPVPRHIHSDFLIETSTRLLACTARLEDVTPDRTSLVALMARVALLAPGLPTVGAGTARLGPINPSRIVHASA